MMRIPSHVLLVVAGVLAAASASAQVPAQAQQAPVAGRPAVRDIDPNTLANAALQVVQGIDAGKMAQMWDGASAVTKRTVKRDDFVAGVTRSRQAHGTPQGRFWIAVRRQQVQTGGKLPAGQYASVEFSTLFPGNKALREVVSFRQDEDGVWRFTGYVLQ